MPSPAERYAAARRRGQTERSRVGRFAGGYPFQLDDFQLRACAAVDAGDGVLVAAPTGSGKTVVGEFAVHLALQEGRKVFYTTPIKALSNQKYADLARRHGPDQVGLLTGDSSVNGEAPVVVMTTEVLRNMLYAGSATLDELGYVVMDEVHYLADRFRGAVWEEVIIHLPRSVQVISLSATVSNAEEFGAWLTQVRGTTQVIVEETRPVPLWQHVLVGRRLYDLFAHPMEPTATPSGPPGSADRPDRSPRPGRGRPNRSARGRPVAAQHPNVPINPQLRAAIEEDRRGSSRHGRRLDAGAPRGRRGRARVFSLESARSDPGWSAPAGSRPLRSRASRSEVVGVLDRAGLLPAITFIFSRVGCDAAVHQLLSADVRLTDPAEGERIRSLAAERVSLIPAEDLAVLGYHDFVEALTRGFAAHHAGMLPTFREIVEDLFTQGRLRMVFATETLALGINMPARTVLLEKLVKFNGESHEPITPAEYTQLTGRAGRRGIDVEGHGVVLWHPSLDPEQVAGLASARTYPLRSSFRPTYNMAVNLVARVGRERTRQVLQTSFAQFQADRAVAGLTDQIRHNEEALTGYAEAMTCHLGDFAEYARIRARISELEKGAVRDRAAARRAAIERSLLEAGPGDVVWLAGKPEPGPAVVLAGHAGGRRPSRGSVSLPVLTHQARLRRILPEELSEPLEVVLRLPLPKPFNARDARARRDLAATLRAKLPSRPYPGERDLDPGVPGRAGTGGPGPTEPDHGADTETPGRPRRQAAELAGLRSRLRDHPCHRCPDRETHARWSQRWWRLRRDTDALEQRVQSRTHSVARTFDRICELLAERGYLDETGRTVTADGTRLRGIYAERDLLAAECLRHGVWDGLDAADLAAAVSCLIHEPRRDDGTTQERPLRGRLGAAVAATTARWEELDAQERRHRVPPGPAPDPGIARMVQRWAQGHRLSTVLQDGELAPGDFVRRCKQLVDLLAQIESVAADPRLSRTAAAAIQAVLRGVVGADRVD